MALSFNPTKCKLMYIGRPLQSGAVTKYCMSDGSTNVEVQTVNEEKELGCLLYTSDAADE